MVKFIKEWMNTKDDVDWEYVPPPKRKKKKVATSATKKIKKFKTSEEVFNLFD